MQELNWQQLLRESKARGVPLLTLAPMVGVSDYALRKMCRQFGADAVFAEMVSTEAIYWSKKKNTKTRKLARMTDAPDGSAPVVLQLFGSDPEKFGYAAREITQGDYCTTAEDDMGRDATVTTRPLGLDINFGCPAKKVFGHGSGAALFASMEKGRDIVATTIDNSAVPVSIKTRAAVCGVTVSEFVARLEGLDIAAITIHGRTFEQKFSGPIDLDEIKRVKDMVGDTPVIVNGCIYKPEDAVTMRERWPEVDGFAIARGVYGQPWIFEQIKELLSTGSYKQKSFDEMKRYILQHAEYAYENKGDRGVIEMRKWLTWYVKGFDGARELRQQLVKVETLEDIRSIIGVTAGAPAVVETALVS